MASEIPLARLPSVNHFRKLNLSTQTLADILTKEEGHPDNVVPSLVGGIIAGCYVAHTCSDVTLSVIDWPFYMFISPYEPKTEDARRVLPPSLVLSEAVEASTI